MIQQFVQRFPICVCHPLTDNYHQDFGCFRIRVNPVVDEPNLCFELVWGLAALENSVSHLRKADFGLRFYVLFNL
jgi:hypothetical protein